MGGDHDGGAALRQRGDAPPKRAARQRVGATGRLVEKQDFRLVQQTHRHRQPLFQAAGQLARPLLLPTAQVELVQHGFAAFAQAFAAQAVGLAEKMQVFQHAQIAVERELLRHIADAAARVCGGGAHVQPGYSGFAAAGGQQAAQHAEGGGFARAVGAEQTENFAVRHVEGGVVHRHEIAETAHQIADGNRGGVVAGKRRAAAFDGGHIGAGIVFLPRAQQHHKAVFQARRHRRNAFGRQPQACRYLRAAHDKVHLPGMGHGVDDFGGIVEQGCLNGARRHVGRRRVAETMPFGLPAQALRRAFGQELPFVHHIHLGAAFGFVHIGGGQHHRQRFFAHQLGDDFP